MSKEKRVVDFYVLCNRLKDVVRTGWKDWGVKRERVESVAEHIFGVQMLAIAMWAEFGYDLDIKKVLAMIAVHEMEEVVIGDFTCFQKTKEERKILGQKAIEDVFQSIYGAGEIKALVEEYMQLESTEARFAYFCDKLECDIQAKLYDEEGCVDLENQENNSTAKDARVQELLNQGMSWSEMWITFHEQKDCYDKDFLEVVEFVKNNKIKKD